MYVKVSDFILLILNSLILWKWYKKFNI